MNCSCCYLDITLDKTHGHHTLLSPGRRLTDLAWWPWHEWAPGGPGACWWGWGPQPRGQAVGVQQRQARQRELAAERSREFQAKNDELLQRKEKRIDDDIAAERVIWTQQAENARRMEAREGATRRIRDEKNRVKNNLIERQVADFAERLARQQRSDSIAESEVERREAAERQRRLKAQSDVRAQRNREWLAHQRARDTR